MYTIFVEVLHHNFWWGVYGIAPLTDWEDVVIYEKENSEFRQVGQVCICSQRYLEASSKANAEEREFVAEIEQFFDQASLAYHFWYDDPQQADSHEVAFEAERDARDCKPSYIEIWYPANGIDIRVI